MRAVGRLGKLCVAVLLAALAAGCGNDAVAAPVDPPPRTYAADAAGGACRLLDYATIAEATGLTFNAAGAGRKDHTYTCALTMAGDAYPVLTFSLAAIGSDTDIYKSALVPKGSTSVAGLGKVAYQASAAASGDHGPRVEVGWLTATKAMVLRLTLASSATADDAAALTPKLVTLAKKIDFASI